MDASAFIVTYPGWYRLLHLGTELNGRVVHSQKLTKTVQRIQSIGGIGYGQARVRRSVVLGEPNNSELRGISPGVENRFTPVRARG